jgi:hypothetical protein
VGLRRDAQARRRRGDPRRPLTERRRPLFFTQKLTTRWK